MPGRHASLAAPLLLAGLALAAPATALPPPAGALDGVACVARPAQAAALGCQPGHDTLVGVHQLVLGPDDAQLYVLAEEDEDVPATASLTTYARDAVTGALTRTACRDRAMGPGCVADSRLRAPEALALSPEGPTCTWPMAISEWCTTGVPRTGR